jgi:hypothetical protein
MMNKLSQVYEWTAACGPPGPMYVRLKLRRKLPLLRRENVRHLGRAGARTVVFSIEVKTKGRAGTRCALY